MTSTYLTYRLLTQDISRTLARTAAKPDVARDEKYYQDHIGQVTSVADLLKDTRLFAYAMKAYGLEDMTYAKAFMRKVLESDLNDSKSFARQLVDQRYTQFAQAFNFNTDGKPQPSLPYVQNDFQEQGTTGLYSQHRVNLGAAAATEAQYYQSKIATVTSINGFLADARLFNFALTAVGLDPSIASTTTIGNVLTSDLSDPNSVANKLGDNRYKSLAAMFSFQTDGNVAAGSTAQSDAQVNTTTFLYYESSGNGSSPAAAAFNTKYYSDNIGSITSVDDLINNDRILAYALTAFGLDPNTTSIDTIRQVLTSDLSDSNSFANTRPDFRFRTLAAAFNFATDGTIIGSQGAQSSSQVQNTTNLYLNTYNVAAASADSAATTFYQNRINLLTSVDDLLDNGSLYTYVLNAYGLDPTTESKAKIRQVLTSDPSDPASFANLQSDTRYKDLVAAFNFGTDGSVLQPRKAQIDQGELDTIQLYNTKLGTSASEQAAATDDNTYYHNTIATIQSVDDFLADHRLVAYVLKAYGLQDENISGDTLRKVLTSDPMDPNSFVSQQSGTGLRDLAAAFNFTSDGKIGRVPEQQSQTRSNILKTTDRNVRQTMESDAGSDNGGVRLALYFQRNATNVNAVFDILADKALFEVVRTALGLPAEMSQADIHVQADMITKRLDVTDFKDPAKLDKLITRFATLYDLNNSGNSTGTSSALTILSGQSATIGTNASLLGSLQGIALN